MVVVLQPFLAEFVRFFKKNTRYEIRDTRYEVRDTRYEICFKPLFPAWCQALSTILAPRTSHLVKKLALPSSLPFWERLRVGEPCSGMGLREAVTISFVDKG